MTRGLSPAFAGDCIGKLLVDREGFFVSAAEWVPALEERLVPEGGYVVAYPKGVGTLIARVDGELYALANRCFHMGCPLEGGKLKGVILTCPCHDWRFDVRDGHFVTAPELRLQTFALRVDAGTISVQMEGS